MTVCHTRIYRVKQLYTRLPSNVRTTTRECVYLVTRGHFLSCDKDGGHTTRSAKAEKPMLHANFMAPCFIEPELMPIEVLHCENGDFRPFCSCDLDFDQMTFIYELDPYSLKIYQMCKYELPTSIKAFKSYCLTDRQTDRQKDRQTRPKLYITPLCRWGRILSSLYKFNQ